MELVKFNSVIAQAYEEIAPHKICSFIYDLANAFNRFYHETKIIQNRLNPHDRVQNIRPRISFE